MNYHINFLFWRLKKMKMLNRLHLWIFGKELPDKTYCQLYGHDYETISETIEQIFPGYENPKAITTVSECTGCGKESGSFTTGPWSLTVLHEREK